MTISLVSAPVLGFDLVRHPAGAQLAETLLRSLTFGPHDLAQAATISDQVSPAARQALTEARAWLGAGSLRGSALQPEPAAEGSSQLGVMIASLRRSMINDLDDLDTLLAKDILAWAADAKADGTVTASQLAVTRQLVLDALAADWVDGLAPRLQAELRAGFLELSGRIGPRRYDLGPCLAGVQDVLDRLAGLGADGRSRLREVNGLLGSSGSAWAEAVHEASWAAFTTGRIRTAATAQFRAVQAFIAGGLTAADGAEGVWNLISGHVQASVVADVLPQETLTLLGRGWWAALGRPAG